MMRRRFKSSCFRRVLGHELLESRSLLAGVIGDSPWQNPLDSDDLDCDGIVSAGDVLSAINAINSGAGGDLALKFAPPMLEGRVRSAAANFTDADGDGVLSAGDALQIINRINSQHVDAAIKNLQTLPDQGDAPETAQSLDLSKPFARVLAVISEPTEGEADVDYFKIETTKTLLNVALFSAGSLKFSVYDSLGNYLGGAAAETVSHRPVKADLTVDANNSYFIKVEGVDGGTGHYALSVLNYDEVDFTLVTDSPLGSDLHSDVTPTALTLNRGHVRVASNIDPGETAEADLFSVKTTTAGKLVIGTSAAFPLSVTLTDEQGTVTPIISTHHVIIAKVTADKLYYIKISAASGTDTGAYQLIIVNVPGEPAKSSDPPSPPKPEDVFAKLDVDKSRGLARAEFNVPLPLNSVRFADQIFASWDANDDGVLDLSEFLAGIRSLPSLLPPPPSGSGIPPAPVMPG
jgi:hypothetical protein